MHSEEHQRHPYTRETQLAKLLLVIASEVPSASLSIFEHISKNETPSTTRVQQLLDKTRDHLAEREINAFREEPREISFLDRGFEASVFSFYSGNQRWVMKIGSKGKFSSGMVAPTSQLYADIQKWNYSVLRKVFSPSLPYLLPYPYFVAGPAEIDENTTLQFMPYINKIPDFKILRPQQVRNLQNEKKEFFSLTQKMLRMHGVIPDLIKPENLRAQPINNEVHLTLIDMGLFNLRLPTPVLNFFGLLAFRLFPYRNLS